MWWGTVEGIGRKKKKKKDTERMLISIFLKYWKADLRKMNIFQQQWN